MPPPPILLHSCFSVSIKVTAPYDASSHPSNTDMYCQQSISNDVKNWLEESTCGSTDVLIADDRRVYELRMVVNIHNG